MLDRNAYAKEYYKKNRTKILAHFTKELNQKRYAERKLKYPERIKESRRKHYEKLKLDIFNLLGYKCECCGESNKKFLSIDHINNDGYKYRPYGALNFYIKVRREGCPKDKYQVLCMNCNFGKARNQGICPHQGEMQ